MFRIVATLRLPFVLLMPCCVAVGMATALRSSGVLDVGIAACVMLGAVASHISVNAFNEYFDFRSGLDSLTQRTPFSGGSGTLPAHPELARSTLAVAVTALLLAGVVGIYLATLRGASLLPLGLAGLVLVVTYSIWWVRRPVACLLAPGLGLGTLTIVGTDFAMTGLWSAHALAASLPVALVVSNLLLLNQFPDVDADRQVGRSNVVIVYGPAIASRVFACIFVAAYASVGWFVLAAWLPVGSLAVWGSAPLAWLAVREARAYVGDSGDLLMAMKLNVATSLLTPTLLAAGIATSP